MGSDEKGRIRPPQVIDKPFWVNPNDRNKFTIELLEAHWIAGIAAEKDRCAHGQVRVQIGDEIVVDRDDNEGWTISATAQLLLRTLERDHTRDHPVGDQLVPCCGHFLVFEDNMDEVYIASCPNGNDWEVRHVNGTVHLTTLKGTQTTINFEAYASQVLSFVDKVEDFYKSSKPKELPEDDLDRKAYLKFWKEWKEKRAKWK